MANLTLNGATRKRDLSDWNTDALVARVTSLEQQLRELTAKSLPPSVAVSTPTTARSKNARVNRVFDPSRYSTRFIALKFAYLGKRYNGFEHHANNKTNLPTIEETLWRALRKARLIFPTPSTDRGADDVSWDGCEYAKCGRTDKGVSAFGQVVSLRVRSNRPLERSQSELNEQVQEILQNEAPEGANKDALESVPPSFDPIRDEISYAQVLNRLLPSDIRVLAWCPDPPPEFSARFSCEERQYRYFFTQPAFPPNPLLSRRDELQDGFLDIDAMRRAAKRFEGLHDFRNFCKVDPTKQIENFMRRIYYSDILEVDGSSEPAAAIMTLKGGTLGLHGDNQHIKSDLTLRSSPKTFMFVLHGSAFLWHQVRCMVAVLFLIGQRLEQPEIIDSLLDVSSNDRKPVYEMADDVPLVLWNCVFPKKSDEFRQDSLSWVFVGDEPASPDDLASCVSSQKGGKFGTGGLVESVWEVWREKKMEEILAGSLLNFTLNTGTASTSSDSEKHQREVLNTDKVRSTQRIFVGGNAPQLQGRYVPLLGRQRLEPVEITNKKYAERKGIEVGYRRPGKERRETLKETPKS
ncbi:hypothetical protein MMC25_007518 [Agyrium rufum]|nr:hypothetical protein [Agyrium rufum]